MQTSKRNKKLNKDTDESCQNFDIENKIIQIEEIINQLETNKLSLDNALRTFENGITLARDCQTQLANAEQKIKTLTTTNKSK